MSMISIGPLRPMNYESITIDSTAGGVALSASEYKVYVTGYQNSEHAVEAVITAETAESRWTVDGTAPTTTVGHVLSAGGSLTVQGEAAIAAFRAIRTGGSSATYHVTYFKR